MVRYARSGGEAMAIAVRIARARTGRDRVAFCGYHGWHDWYLAANLSEERALDGHLLPGLAPAGVPRGLIGTAWPFRYNHLEELTAIEDEHGDELAAIVLEPIRDQQPDRGFLEGVRQTATRTGAVLIADEISAGFRLITGGAHLTFGLTPEIAVLAKALGNGYPIAAVIGTADIMQAAQSTFISSTNWTERIGPAAAIATIQKHRRCDVTTHLSRIGSAVQVGWREAAARAGLPVSVSGIPPLGHLTFTDDPDSALRTLFTQLMLEQGFLAGSGFYATYAHTEGHVAEYIAAAEKVFRTLAEAKVEGTVAKRLRGPAAHSGFRRLA
jgi:glutamate-1-semialdehyde 2,1-aminomutase